MRSLALLLTASALTFALPATAQVVGSGIAPATIGNSTERPLAFSDNAATGGVLIIPMTSKALPTGLGIPTDALVRTQIEAAIAAAKFEGKAGSSLSLRGIGGYARIYLAGAGTEGSVATRMRDAAGKAAQELKDEASVISFAAAGSAAETAEAALGYALGQYRFDRYKTVGKTAPPSQPVTFLTAEAQAAQALWTGRGMALAEGVKLSRDLATEPANVIYPESFVDRVRAAFGNTPGVTIEVLDEPAMRKLGMGSLIGVGQGARRPSRLLTVSYKGAGNKAPLAFVGKGITFDSGGISIKPALGMWEMKGDMSGAASAVGAVLSLAKSKAPVNVLGVAALSENMPDGNAQRPGDVVRTMNGKTIEVLNTDAEGRLVLADANEYVIAQYKPAGLINIATLTGSVLNALDDEYAGVFARDEALGAAVMKAGETTGEVQWRLPLHKNYAEDMKSDIADIKNVVEGGRPGAGLGAHFIGFFVDEKTPWVHLDIAGVNSTTKGNALTPKGMTGWGVRLFDQVARDLAGR
jgi:leucyl aminopeptidase